METINFRIKLVKAKNFGDQRGSHKLFCEKLGVSSNVVSNWIRENYNIGRDVIEQIIRSFPDINANWLLTGDGEMQNNSNGSMVQEPPALYGKTIVDMLKAGEIYPSFVVEKKEKEIALLNQEIGRLKAELDQKKKVSALLEDNAGVADAG